MKQETLIIGACIIIIVFGAFAVDTDTVKSNTKKPFAASMLIKAPVTGMAVRDNNNTNITDSYYKNEIVYEPKNKDFTEVKVKRDEIVITWKIKDKRPITERIADFVKGVFKKPEITGDVVGGSSGAYRILRGEQNNRGEIEYYQIRPSISCSEKTCTLRDKRNLVSGKAYYYKIVRQNEQGEVTELSTPLMVLYPESLGGPMRGGYGSYQIESIGQQPAETNVYIYAGLRLLSRDTN